MKQILIERGTFDEVGPLYFDNLTSGGVVQSPSSLQSIADMLRDAAERRRLRDVLKRHANADTPNLSAALQELQALRQSSACVARAFALPELEKHTFNYRAPVLERDGAVILREGNLAQVTAPRGIGKTLFLQTLELVVATAGRALGFYAMEPLNVLRIDGEMAGEELKDRYAMIRDRLGFPDAPRLTVLAADWQDDFLPRLDTAAGQAAVEPYVEAANLIVIDNRSTLFDPEGESDPVAWQPAQEWLLSLRRRRKAVIVVHHANRQGGARGHSKAEDILNLTMKLSRPEGYVANEGARFLVEFDKTRGIHGLAVAPFTASLDHHGWHAEVEGSPSDSAKQKLLEYVRVAHDAGDRPRSANAAVRGAQVNRQTGLGVWAELLREGIVQQHRDGGFYAP